MLILVALLTGLAGANAFRLPPDLQQDYRLDPAKARAALERTHKDLEIHFVLAGADERFAWLPYEEYSPRFELEKFSEKASFGRMLCPGHARNPVPMKFVIVVRADEPGDTLAHEYIHYLQARADPKICELFGRLETQPSQEDLTKNAQLEYEANRFTFEKKAELKLNELTQLGIIERLAKFSNESGDTQPIDRKNGWTSKKDWTELLLARAEKLEAQIRARSRSQPDLEEVGASLEHGISLLKDKSKKKTPFCFNSLNDLPQPLRQAAEKSVQTWNQLSLQTIGFEVIQAKDCKGPKLRFVLEAHEQERFADGRVQFAKWSPPETIVLRPSEFKDYEGRISGILRKKESELTPEARQSAKSALSAFYESTRLKMLRHVLTHELGHALGLGHNFNAAEKSVMSYDSELLEPSAYDAAALKLAWLGTKPTSGTWKASLEAPKSSTVSAD